jgi:hypothetical protein
MRIENTVSRYEIPLKKGTISPDPESRQAI